MVLWVGLAQHVMRKREQARCCWELLHPFFLFAWISISGVEGLYETRGCAYCMLALDASMAYMPMKSPPA